MIRIYRKTLIATAIAALLSAPAWSDDDKSGFSEAAKSAASKPLNSDSRSELDRLVDGASRAAASNNPLYSRTPASLDGMEVIGSDGGSLGEIVTVVMPRDRSDVHAVVSSGGVLGIGARRILIPIGGLEVTSDEQLQANFNLAAAAKLPEFQREHYGVLETDRRIGDFSAFEPTMSAAGQASARADLDSAKVEKAERSAAAAKLDNTTENGRPESAAKTARAKTSSDASKAEMPAGAVAKADKKAMNHKAQTVARSDKGTEILNERTAKDLQGMEVVGIDCQNIGKISNLVASNNGGQVHAVIATGRFLNLAARDIIVPLNGLKIVGDKQLQADFNQDAVEASSVYEAEKFGELEADRLIGEFLAFESNSKTK